MIIKENVLKVFKEMDINVMSMGDKLFDNLSMDSQEVVELIINLTKSFNATLELDDITKAMTVLDVVSLVEARSANNAIGE